MSARLGNPVFDELLAAAEPHVLAGEHRRDVPPEDGGRWPVRVLVRPTEPVRGVLEGLMRGALDFAGPGHFLTGRADSVHLTVRALEPYREAARQEDPVTANWVAALERAAAATTPFTLSLTGVTLTTAGVMAQLETRDERPWQFMDRVRDELGRLAWYEEQWMRRNIWYASLVHFADDIADPAGLLAWVHAHRRIEPVEVAVDAVGLARFRYSEAAGERLMLPQSWQVLPLRG